MGPGQSSPSPHLPVLHCNRSNSAEAQKTCTSDLVLTLASPGLLPGGLGCGGRQEWGSGPWD